MEYYSHHCPDHATRCPIRHSGTSDGAFWDRTGYYDTPLIIARETQWCIMLSQCVPQGVRWRVLKNVQVMRMTRTTGERDHHPYPMIPCMDYQPLLPAALTYCRSATSSTTPTPPATRGRCCGTRQVEASLAYEMPFCLFLGLSQLINYTCFQVNGRANGPLLWSAPKTTRLFDSGALR